MKTVFSDVSQVTHLWANQLQDNAKNSGHNFFFSGKTIYSYGYHFPIAKHVTNDNGQSCVLFTERSYSLTTAKHISVVRQAVNHKDIVYCYSPESSHEEHFKHWLRNAESVAKSLLSARKPEKYLNELQAIKDRVQKYCTFFSVVPSETLTAVLSIGNKAEFSQYADKKAEYEKAEAVRQQKELEKKHKKSLAEWRKGKTHRLYTHNGYDFLRLNTSENRIETTQAVQIPFELGKKLWESIKDNKLTVGEKVMNFEVLEVGKTVKIGCHNFKTDYLLKFGQQIFAN